MASNGTRVGGIDTGDGGTASVWRNEEGIVTIFTAPIVKLSPGKLAEYRELLDRAAMPGQPGGSVIRYPVYGCCEHCEHCEHERCRQAPGRHCQHGADQPPHDVPCGSPACAAGNTTAGEAAITVPEITERTPQ